MQKLSDATETVVVSVKMPLAMRDALDRSVTEEGHANRSEAARVAIEKGLNGTAAPTKRRRREAAKPSAGCPHPLSRRIGTGCGRCGTDPV